MKENCNICENNYCVKDKCIFEVLSYEEVANINSQKQFLYYNKKDSVDRNGGEPSMNFICEGYVKVFLNGNFKNKFLVEILGPFSIIPSQISCNESIQTVIALTNNLKVCKIKLQDIVHISEKNGKFATTIWRKFISNSSNSLAHFSSIALKRTRGRLADILIYLENNFKEVDIYQMISRKDLAELANISHENAIRTLHEFEDEGIISNKKKRIEIIDYEALRKISTIS